jgi:hypothetical protein
MLKDTTYKQKFSMLKSWMPSIIETVKKDLKNDHLKQDRNFSKKFLGSKNINKLTNEDLVTGYSEAMQDEELAESLGEYVSNRWLIKNVEVYHFFEEKLRQINPNFNEIDQIDNDKANEIINEAVGQFGAAKTYLFSVMNAVVFPKESYDKLAEHALKDEEQQSLQNQANEESLSIENVKRSFETQIARLTDKYEKKLTGLEKKYHQDTETLKKQISSLQRKLNS